MLGPSATASRFTLSFTRGRYCRHCRTDRGDRYGPMEWAQSRSDDGRQFQTNNAECRQLIVPVRCSSRYEFSAWRLETPALPDLPGSLSTSSLESWTCRGSSGQPESSCNLDRCIDQSKLDKINYSEPVNTGRHCKQLTQLNTSMIITFILLNQYTKNIPKCDISLTNVELHQAYCHVVFIIVTWPYTPDEVRCWQTKRRIRCSFFVYWLSNTNEIIIPNPTWWTFTNNQNVYFQSV